ncbi:MAG: ABC transporter permease [Rheinheimera sp.]|uniref:ABC transporter permease subunit n=1 Tax=Arsukibacterium sp. UBA3155 TaxID=1946058 RepID=UPI000C8DB338|nr:ABC transporter permease subunit [Arsukibacterium sp. UBA3155]MAD75439.1 ABC transporter permease [Rheinheimera sp.]|tara:strand:+ start:55751 stop:57571 length:1821 start_codon:yes stop_codon:yes gene_type:complete
MTAKPLSAHQASRGLQRRRRWYNRLLHAVIGLSGISVVLMLAAMFIYLFSEVIPVLRSVTGTALPPVVSERPSELAAQTTAGQNGQFGGAEISVKNATFIATSSSGQYQLTATATGHACLRFTKYPAGCIQQWQLTQTDDTLTSLRWLTADQAVLAGYQSGRLQQWYLLAENSSAAHLQLVRELPGQQTAIMHIAAEHNRRGFATLAADGTLALYYSSLARPLWQQNTAITAAVELVFSADNQKLSIYTDTSRYSYALNNPHPEVNWQTLWHSVWYEGFARPDVVWQTSSAADNYQPKFSLVPLTTGTLKAAFYAMLFAAPLAIMAAIYTACFLPAGPRRRIKGLIELMAAFPTVILGFIAAVWLAPVIEAHLLALLLWVILLPLSILALAAIWPRVPFKLKQRCSDGWEIVLLMVWLAVVSALVFVVAGQLDSRLFEDGLRAYLEQQGMYYEQRNALVIGIAMGFAVVPGIFAIADDVLHQVPPQLTRGALALGATPWQTVLRISLPLAAPGLIAATLVGVGRAIGETMIILMATGNSPITNFNVFEGLRSLTATLAMELPEATVGSSHFRVLFVAALVLLLFTFAANTTAEVIRQRLRKKYQRL